MRRIVTVVFADVAGSTALGERLDPETLRRVMARYFAQARSILERHGGTVEKFIGDAVMAAFGIPNVHEDDALRAVRAAVELRAAVAELNVEFERSWGLKLELRIGVNTGEVVAGDPSQGQSYATGDSVNVAARLEQSAAPGEILIGETTRRLVRDAVTVESRPPFALKGKQEAVPAWKLVDMREVAPTRSRLDSPLVGRARELELLAAAFDGAVRESTCELATVIGPAGVGKSRLADEFAARVEPRARVLRGRCLPYGEGITFWPLTEVVREAAGITGAEAPEEARARIAAQLPGDRQSELAETIAGAVGLNSATVGLEETFWAVRSFLEALAGARPLLVVFDDIHWGEPTFLDLIEYVAARSRERPIMLLCLARPELLELRPAWIGPKPYPPAIVLEALREAESARLIDHLIGRADLPGDVVVRILEAAEGNPLFLEELVRMLVDDDLLQRRNGDWQFVGDLSAVTMPATIQSLLAARLDRLATGERGVVERASVVGKVFWWRAVSELSDESARPAIGSYLQTLVRKELIEPHADTLAGEDAFRFRHILIRDAAYEGIAKEVRAQLHERFARWLEQRALERASEYEEILGYHLEQAYRYQVELAPVDERVRELAARARERLRVAGERAFSRGDMPAAASLLARAVELSPREDRPRDELLPALGFALAEVGELEGADRLLNQAVEGARTAGDRRLEWRALLERSALAASMGGSMEEAVTVAECAVTVFEQLRDEAGLARAWHLLGKGRFWLGQAAAAEAAWERALACARATGDHRGECETLCWLPAALVFGPTPTREAIGRCEDIRRSHVRDRKVEAFAVLHRAALEAMQGSFLEARQLLEETRAMLEALGLAIAAAGASHISFYVEMLAGNPARAERDLVAAYDVLERAGEKAYLSDCAAQLAQAIYEQGRYDEAERFAETSRAAAAADDIDAQVRWRCAYGKALARRGEFDAAERLCREAVRRAEQTDYLSVHADALLDLAEALRLKGRSEEAAHAAARAVELYGRKGNAVSERRARRLVDRFRTDASPAS